MCKLFFLPLFILNSFGEDKQEEFLLHVSVRVTLKATIEMMTAIDTEMLAVCHDNGARHEGERDLHTPGTVLETGKIPEAVLMTMADTSSS